MGQSPWTSARQTPARWVVAFLIVVTAFALWAVATSIVTTKSTSTSHIVVQAARARRVEPVARDEGRPLPAPPLPSATPEASPTPTPVAVKQPTVFEPAKPEPSDGPAINDRPPEPRPPDPMDFHHDPSEAVDVPPENNQ